MPLLNNMTQIQLVSDNREPKCLGTKLPSLLGKDIVMIVLVFITAKKWHAAACQRNFEPFEANNYET